MSDRHAGYIVTLAKDVREDDAESVVTALRMVKGVVAVKPIVASFEVAAGETRARLKVVEKLHAVVREILDGK